MTKKIKSTLEAAYRELLITFSPSSSSYDSDICSPERAFSTLSHQLTVFRNSINFYDTTMTSEGDDKCVFSPVSYVQKSFALVRTYKFNICPSVNATLEPKTTAQ